MSGGVAEALSEVLKSPRTERLCRLSSRDDTHELT